MKKYQKSMIAAVSLGLLVLVIVLHLFINTQSSPTGFLQPNKSAPDLKWNYTALVGGDAEFKDYTNEYYILMPKCYLYLNYGTGKLLLQTWDFRTNGADVVKQDIAVEVRAMPKETFSVRRVSGNAKANPPDVRDSDKKKYGIIQRECLPLLKNLDSPIREEVYRIFGGQMGVGTSP